MKPKIIVRMENATYLYCVCVHRCMTTKTLSVTEDVYLTLKRMKLEGESFSDTIRRLTERGSIAECAGLWGDMTDEEERKIKDAILEMRNGATRRLVKRVEKD